jgi:hypothetical protein
VSIPGTHYQVGLVPAKGEFKGSFALATDFYDDRVGEAVGPNFDKLLMFYQMERARAVAQRNGDMYREIPLHDGSFTVEVDTTVRLGA